MRGEDPGLVVELKIHTSCTYTNLLQHKLLLNWKSKLDSYLQLQNFLCNSDKSYQGSFEGSNFWLTLLWWKITGYNEQFINNK